MLSQRERGAAERKTEEALAGLHLTRAEGCVVGCWVFCRPGDPVIIPSRSMNSTPEIALPIFRIIFVPNFKLLRTEEKTHGGQLRWFPQAIIVTKSYGSLK